MLEQTSTLNKLFCIDLHGGYDFVLSASDKHDWPIVFANELAHIQIQLMLYCVFHKIDLKNLF